MMAIDANEEPQAPAIPMGKDEMNFAEFPITLLTDRVPKGQNTLKSEDQIYDAKRKRIITRKRLIEGSKEFGLPTATDDTVILALIQLTKLMSDFNHREVQFSRLELIRMLGWPNEGKSYSRIKLSLQRIAHVTYNYDNSWWDARRQCWTTKIFHILDNVEINDARVTDGNGELDQTRIVWNEVVFESFQSGFLRNIDFQLCMNLEHPTALRMYRFLGKRFYLSSDLTFELKEFAFEHIGIKGNYEGGAQIARKLQPAINELEAVGFLEPLDEQQRFLKRGRYWGIRLIQKKDSPGFRCLGDQAAADQLDADRRAVAAELVQRGVTKLKANRLSVAFSLDWLRARIDVHDWLVEIQDQRVSKNPSGWLVQSIQENYTIPKGYKPKAERLKPAEAQRGETTAEKAATRLLARNKDRERSEQKAIDAYWKSLSRDEQAAIDTKILEQADPEDLAKEVGPLKRIGQTIRRNEYILQLIRDRQPTLFEV